jgi:hypothetical protein
VGKSENRKKIKGCRKQHLQSETATDSITTLRNIDDRSSSNPQSSMSLDKCYIESCLQNLRCKGDSEVPSVVCTFTMGLGVLDVSDHKG